MMKVKIDERSNIHRLVQLPTQQYLDENVTKWS